MVDHVGLEDYLEEVRSLGVCPQSGYEDREGSNLILIHVDVHHFLEKMSLL